LQTKENMTFINELRNIKTPSFKNLAVAALVYNLSASDLARADQPVHCLRDDAFGEWEFHVSQDVSSVNLF